ncbi:MAG: carboxypeptidase-like regulatory domain-containing protein, partial [Myxococcota bacterium]
RRKQIDLGPQQRETIIFNPPEAGGRATVVTNDKDAIVTISGANLEKPIREKASFLIKPLPPGKYKITVKYPGGTIRKKDFTMSRGKSTSLVFTPPGQPGIKLQTTPRGVSVFVVKPKSKDKKARERYRGKTDLRLLLNVGEHRLRFKKTCYLPQEQSVQVQNDSEKLLKLDFVRDPVYLKWKKREDRIPVSRAWGWILTSVGIVGLISGTGFTIGANNSHEQALRERQLNGDDYSQFAAEGNAFRTISLFGFGVGGASMVAGIVFLVNSQSVPFARVPCKVRLAEDE